MGIPREVSSYINSLMGRSPKTKQNYESFARVFWEYIGNKGINEIEVEDVMSFLNNGASKLGWKPSTTAQYSVVAGIFFNEFRDEAFNKLLKKRMRMLPKTQAHANLLEGIYVPPDKIDLFISDAPDEEWAILYTMILKWGLRLGETLRICPADIDVEKNRVIVKGKGLGGFGKLRQVLVEKSTITRVLQHAKCSQDQILGLKPIRDDKPIIKRIKERNAEYQWKLTARKVGLKFWKRLTPHDGRHSYAIDFLIRRKKEGMAALVLLKNQLGHASIDTTLIYLDIAGAEAEDIFAAGFTNKVEL